VKADALPDLGSGPQMLVQASRREILCENRVREQSHDKHEPVALRATSPSSKAVDAFIKYRRHYSNRCIHCGSQNKQWKKTAIKERGRKPASSISRQRNMSHPMYTNENTFEDEQRRRELS
jgi:hypothetical protein